MCNSLIGTNSVCRYRRCCSEGCSSELHMCYINDLLWFSRYITQLMQQQKSHLLSCLWCCNFCFLGLFHALVLCTSRCTVLDGFEVHKREQCCIITCCRWHLYCVGRVGLADEPITFQDSLGYLPGQHEHHFLRIGAFMEKDMGHSQEVTHLACVATALPLIAQNNSQHRGDLIQNRGQSFVYIP